MVVIKIGGSLQSSAYIKRWIKTIELEFDNSFLLIFGGGKYADQVRKEQKIKHVVLNAKNHENEAEVIANAGKKGSVIITTSISNK